MEQDTQTHTVEKVEFRAMREDWGMFEVLVYESEADQIPLTDFSPTMFQRVDNVIEKRKTDDMTEVYTNPRGLIEVKLEREGMKGSVTLEPA